MKLAIAIVLLAAVGSHWSHLERDRTKPAIHADAHHSLPSLPALDILSLSYRTIVADYFYLYSVQYYGTRKYEKDDYPALGEILRRVHHLDPKFEYPYVFGGQILPTLQGQLDLSIELLKKGYEEIQSGYAIPFVLGFVYYFHKQDYANAGKVLERAAREPDAPQLVVDLAAGFLAYAGNPQMGIALVDSLLKTVTDEDIRTGYIEKRKRLVLEFELSVLRKRSRMYQERKGSAPSNFQQLVDADLLPEIPKPDEFGGTFYIDDSGVVQTTSHEQLIHLEK